MMEPKYLVLTSLTGFVLMVIGFAGYVISPSAAFQAVFAAGVVLLAAGYILLYLSHRSVVSEVRAEEREEDEKGFFYIMDEDYSASVGDTTIEDLTRREE